MTRTPSRAERIIDAGARALSLARLVTRHVACGNSYSAELAARVATRAGIEAMRIDRPISCCDALHYGTERCASFGASESQIQIAEDWTP